MAPAIAFILALPLANLCIAEDDIAPFDEAALREDAKKTFKEKVGPFAERYCVKCHGSRPKGGVNLQSALKSPGSTASFLHWKKAVANVKVHDMPPEDAKLPSEEERQQFIGWIGKLKYLAPQDPGSFVIRRLTKVEYGNTLHDLYGVDSSIADSLPDEVAGEGYLNSISPLQSELFLDIADQVVRQALAPEGQEPTALQKRLFGGEPPEGSGLQVFVRQVARKLARDAYRRPPSEEELDVLVDIYGLGRDNQLDHTASLCLMLKAVLVSPQFLFVTPALESKPQGSVVPLDDHQLASRLSYLLWSAPPDEALSALADQGELQNPEVLRSQIHRLLQHDRSRALFDGFGTHWLQMGGLESKVFDTALFPQMTPVVQKVMVEEARLFFLSIIRENQPVHRFVDSDYTYLDESLSQVYGLGGTVTGPGMRRVKLDDPNRGGLLGMPATLSATSFPNRTSPVRRGVWVLEQVLGEQVPPPPPNVPALDKQDQKSVEGLTLRQRTELHQSDPTCANCHKLLDPLGFGLENFDAIGRWREKDQLGVAIDSLGKLPDGKEFTTPAELKRILAAREPALARNFTERLMAYALGRQLEGYDEVVVDRLVEKAAKDGYRVQSMVTEVLSSYLFTHRKVEG